MKSASEIINIVLEVLGKNANTFAKELGIPRSQTIYDLQNGKVKSISKNLISKINATYPNVDTWFLLTGEGHPLNSVADAQQERKMLQQPTDGYIPVYDITFSLGFTPTFLNSQTPEILGYVNFTELRGSTYIVQAKGNSMAPLINDRDFVGIRPVKNKKNIDFGNPYGIITEDLAVFKKIKKFSEDEDKILLISENPEHESYPIEKNEIIHLFSVIGILSVKSITY